MIISVRPLFRILVKIMSLVLLCSTSIVAQSHLIFFRDTVTQNRFMARFENTMNQPYYGYPFYYFKEYLPDGKYEYVKTLRTDSSKIAISDFVIASGYYLDSLRTGRFESYAFCKISGKRKETRVLTHIFNYEEGLLNGYYANYNCLGKTMEGHYKHGKRHGYFLTYGIDGRIVNLELYRNDTLIFYSDDDDEITKALPGSEKEKIINHYYLEKN